MKTPTPVMIASVLLVAIVSATSATDAKIVPGDAQDVVFLTDGRPVFLRLHVQVDGEGFDTVWARYVDKLFKQLDRDNDGKLDRKEAGRGPWQTLVVGFLSRQPPGILPLPRSLNQALADGPLTVEQFLAALRKDTQPLSAYDQRSASSAQSATLLKHLDAEGDGKMSERELKSAEDSLRALDRNDDEIVTANELQPNTGIGYVQAVAAIASGGGSRSAKLLLLGTDGATQTVVPILLQKYGKAARGKINRQELSLTVAAFAKLDADEDGQLDGEEVTRLVQHPRPDVQIIVRIGKRKRGQPRYEVHQAALDAWSTPAKVSTLSAGAMMLECDAFRLEFRNPKREYRVSDDRRVRLQVFNQADRDNNKYLDANETRRYFGNVFPAMDADGDEKVFEKEYLAYFTTQQEAGESRTQMTLHDRGRQLFEALDANSDGRLGLREMRGAAKRLMPRDRDRDGSVALGEVKHHYRLTFARGQASNMGFFGLNTVARRDGAAPPAAARGPRWFQKMDRNGDGDISPREFLGARAAFGKLDADGDGLIDAEEAANAKK